MLDNMNPQTKKLLMVGIPVVAVIAFVMILKGKGSSTSSAQSSTPATGSLAPAPYAGTAVDTGQLAAYESTVTGQLGQIQQAIAAGENLNGSSPTPAATPAAPAPFNPYPVGTVVGASGEKIVQAVPWSGGYVDVTNQGGLYTTGAAPSGSAYSGTPGDYSAQVQGSTIYEYTPTGVQQFSI